MMGLDYLIEFDDGGMGKRCPSCERDLQLEDFHRDRSRPSGRARYCKSCKSNKRSADDYLRAYGLTPEQYAQRLHAQLGRCAICQQPPQDPHLFVDHDHTTGAVRGLLCRRCNSGLGMFLDDINLLAGAIVYLNQSRNA